MSFVKNRLLRTLSANVFGQLVTVGIQLSSVPLFLSVWNAEKYGEWLLISSIPTFLTVGSNGLATCAGTEMIIARESGKTSDAITVYQTTIALLVGFALITLLGGVFVAPNMVQRFMNFQVLSDTETFQLCCIFAIQLSALFLIGVAISGFRSASNFARGFMWQHISRAVGFAAMAAALIWSGKPVHTALANLIGISLVTIAALLDLHYRARWLPFGIQRASWSCLKRLFKPMLADVSMPMGDAIRIQGITLAVGLFLSSAEVVTLTACRTLSNVVFQFTRIFNRAVQQEMSVAFGANDMHLMRRMHSRLLQSSILVSLVAGGGALFFGNVIFRVWTQSKIPFHANLFVVLMLAAVIHAITMVNATISRSVNRHQLVALYSILSALLTIMLAIPMAHYLQKIESVAVALVVGNICFMIASFYEGLKVTDDTRADMLRRLSSLPKIRIRDTH